MDALIAFIVAVVISFLGSVFLGLVNVAVIDTAINKSSKSAMWLALGGVIPEIPYTLIAIFGTSYVDLLTDYKNAIGVCVGLVFVAMGTSYLRKSKSESEVRHVDVNEVGALNHFIKGFLLAIANPQLIFFWSTYLLLIQTGSFNIFDDRETLIDFQASGLVSPKLTFAAGAVVGALLILMIYIKLSSIYKERLIGLIGEKLSLIIGWLFILLGIFTIVFNAI
ncbi:MAG: LysE family translocator [Bacteroidia bacterium]